MKKRISGLLIIIMTLALLPGCGKTKETNAVPEYRTISVDDLEILNADVPSHFKHLDLEIHYNRRGDRVDRIYGMFAYFPVTDKDTAFEAFLGVSELLGVDHPEEFRYDERFTHSTNDYTRMITYHFDQYYNGLEVFKDNNGTRAYVEMCVSPEYSDQYQYMEIRANHVPYLTDLDTEPEITAEQALKIAEEKNWEIYDRKPDLVIDGHKLAYRIDLWHLIDAHTRDLIIHGGGEVIVD